MGKITSLTVGKENEFKSSHKQDSTECLPADPQYQMFLDSLVSNISARGGVGKVKVLTFEDSRNPARSSQRNRTSGATESGDSGYEQSPYPQVDQFIARNISNGGVQGEIRRWVYFPQGKLITYDIVKNHWCENIGRAHKSNHIMMVVDLKTGIYYQKCHDPECKKTNFRSPGLPIPDEINPFHLEQVDKDFFEEGEEHDAELCRLAAQSEEMHKAVSRNDSQLCRESNESSYNFNVRNIFSNVKELDQSRLNDPPSNPHQTCDSCVASPVSQDVGCGALPSADAGDCSDTSVAEHLSAECGLDGSRGSRDSALALSDAELFDCLVWEVWEDD